jgi:hypothetical protein
MSTVKARTARTRTGRIARVMGASRRRGLRRVAGVATTGLLLYVAGAGAPALARAAPVHSIELTGT